MSMVDRLDEYLRYAENMAEEQIEHCRRFDKPGVYDAEELLQKMRDFTAELSKYVLVHKSHVRTMQAYDMSKSGYLTRADIMAVSSDICPDVETMYSKLSMEDLLKQHEDWTVDELIRYLEAPKPEQTQPAHP